MVWFVKRQAGLRCDLRRHHHAGWYPSRKRLLQLYSELKEIISTSHGGGEVVFSAEFWRYRLTRAGRFCWSWQMNIPVCEHSPLEANKRYLLR